jgi:hypothetical protein
METREIVRAINPRLSGSCLKQDWRNACATLMVKICVGFCCGGSAAGFAARRRQDGRFVWVLLSGTVGPRVRAKILFNSFSPSHLFNFIPSAGNVAISVFSPN